MTQKKFDFGEILPFGPCIKCLETMIDPEHGKTAITRDLGGERSLVAVFCEHTQCGAYTFVGKKSATQWQMVTPVDLLAFLGMVDRTAAMFQPPAGTAH